MPNHTYLPPSSHCHVLRDTPSSAADQEKPNELTASSNQLTDKCHVLRDTFQTPAKTLIELRVRNHPGTMSHIIGLFARRGFNLDAIVCAPVDDGEFSRALLLVSAAPRLEQLERQLARLYDVVAIRHRPDLSASFFDGLSLG